MNSVFGSGGSTNMLVSSTAAAGSDVGAQPAEVEAGLGHGQPADEVRGELVGLHLAEQRRATSSTSESPTVYSEAATSISRCRPSSLAASASPSRSWSR